MADHAAEGKSALGAFGEAPKTEVEYEEADSPATDSKGQPAARAAMDGVTDSTKPGQDVAVGQEKGGPDLGSGNAPLRKSPPPQISPFNPPSLSPCIPQDTLRPCGCSRTGSIRLSDNRTAQQKMVHVRQGEPHYRLSTP